MASRGDGDDRQLMPYHSIPNSQHVRGSVEHEEPDQDQPPPDEEEDQQDEVDSVHQEDEDDELPGDPDDPDPLENPVPVGNPGGRPETLPAREQDLEALKVGAMDTLLRRFPAPQQETPPVAPQNPWISREPSAFPRAPAEASS